MAAEDAKRLGGRAAELVLAGQARDAGAPPARRGRRDQPVELAVHDAGRADRAGARVRQRGGVDAGAVDRGVRGRARASASPTPTCRPGVFNLVTGPGPVVGDEIARNPGTDGVAFIGSTATGPARRPGGRRQGGAARDGRQRPAGRDGRRRRRRGRRRDADRLLPVRRPELHRRRADPRPPRGPRRVRRAARAARRPSGSCSATRSTTRPRWARSTTSRSRPRWTSTSHDALARGASVVSGGARAGGFPTALYWQPTVLDRRPGRRPRRGRGDVRADRPGGRDRLARGGDRAHQRLALRPARGDLHRRPRRTASSSPTGSARAGSTSTSRATTGRRTSRSAAARAPTAGSAGSAART